MDPFDFQSQQHWHQNPYGLESFYQPMPQRRGLNQVFHKLLGKGHNPYGRIPQAPFLSGPGMTTKYTQLYETLNHIQKGLGLIQQVSPYIKQYGPFVKNLPMFVDMVKIMMENDDEAEDQQDFDHHEEDDIHDHHDQNKSHQKINNDYGENEHQHTKKKTNAKKGELPGPKLYI